MEPLLSDPFYDFFTRPIINNRREKKLCGNGPSLALEVATDLSYEDLTANIKTCFSQAFASIEVYRDNLLHFRDMYIENESLDIANMEIPEEDVTFFSESLQLYNAQIEAISKVHQRRNIGLFVVDSAPFIRTFTPSPNHCLEIILKILPLLAKKKLESVIAEVQEAEFQLTRVPETTPEYVKFLDFLDMFTNRIEQLSFAGGNVVELYLVIAKNKIPFPDEDRVLLQTLDPSIVNVRITLDNAITKQATIQERFGHCLQSEAAALDKEIKLIRQRIQDPYLLAGDSDPAFACTIISNIIEDSKRLYDKSVQIKSHQHHFGLDITRFDELDDVRNELKLKNLLWNSIIDWEKQSAEWYETRLEDLKPEQMNSEIVKYVKNTHQLEKGLPPNDVIPVLRKNVMKMKEKMPVIANLLNPNLKLRHWKRIQEIVGHPLPQCLPKRDAEFVNLQLLYDWSVFEKAEAISEVTGQASGEASLEKMIKSIEKSWKKAELIAVPYRDQKDVCILGGTDDVQILLDDSLITIATIASSRYVEPIREKVEDWQSQLNLMNDTLHEWLAFQRNWVYLEPIFTASDIQRQLPDEAKMFLAADKAWKTTMRKMCKFPYALRFCTQHGLLEQFQSNNTLLDHILKCLEAYLEMKRMIFPRFYFLSNDELIEILSQSKNPQAVQPHLRKCFDAISSLEFATASVSSIEDKLKVLYTNDILAMVSPEGESVSLGKSLKARGNVEDWLGKVEEAMVVNLRKRTKFALNNYMTQQRETWCLSHPSQVVLTVSQTIWCRETTVCLLKPTWSMVADALRNFESSLFQRLNKLAALVQTDLSRLHRNILTSLITIDVHARDVITDMVRMMVHSPTSFDWLRQLRYYWDPEADDCVVRCAGSLYKYGYEYLGACPRLVITPLTDRCYLCLMGALQLNLGGAPAGPAGTGKTETTKDLAKALAKQCVVFNCSEGLDYKMMGRFFSGLAQSGAWCCFDEFNRIDIEVLSVIAQQLLTIRNAKVAGVARFLFEGREIKLDKTCAAFVTMNPGYAGRTELPDNLKALFRPIAMMVPDYKLIAEVILYSEGFESSKVLAQKMVQMYKLCSEQLSQQDHYDFGMRAVKSVLVMAGSLKRESPDILEDVVLIRALRDSNLPKFLAQDANLFRAILSDLFPGVDIPDHDYGLFETNIRECLVTGRLQPVSAIVKKVIQLHETLRVRHGVMLVGATGGGKTTVYTILAKTLNKLHEKDEASEYKSVKKTVLNPKSITMGELYGETDRLTLEWKDGLMGISVREAVQDQTDDHKWIICDGPVDALWIENMNTLLDDNKMLCLANSERIKLNDTIRMLFEVQDLAAASPATVSRCGMVYVDPEDLGWRPYVTTWLAVKMSRLKEETRSFIFNLFQSHFGKGLKSANFQTQVMKQVPSGKLATLCSLMHSLLFKSNEVDFEQTPSQLHSLIACVFAFSFVWALAGNLNEAEMEKFETFARNQLDEIIGVKLPSQADLFSVYVDLGTGRFELWERTLSRNLKYDKEQPFFEILIPTVDTARYSYLMENLVVEKKPVLFTGETGVGKSVIVYALMDRLSKEKNYLPVFMNFSAQTSSLRTQELIESKLERKTPNCIGPPFGKHVLLFADDLNMPKLDTCGSQPPIELLRQFVDFGGLYDREKLFWKKITDVTITAACAPPGGGRNPITPRFLRHFAIFALPSPSEHNLKLIFSTILRGFLVDFAPSIKKTSQSLVDSAVDLYRRLSTDLLPTPAKSHYVFNLRDLSKCFQGMLRADPNVIRKKTDIHRLFFHETLRVFHDRLVNAEDKSYFYALLSEVANKNLRVTVTPESFVEQPIIFCDYVASGASRESRQYKDYSDRMEKVRGSLDDYLDEYNTFSQKDMNLVFFQDAIEHISRITRMIVTPRGNALLVGVGGCGKQSLTRLACFVCGYQCYEIELTRQYNHSSFREDLKQLYRIAGVKGENTVFLFTDTQIVDESFLEDINNILNSGEVPNLFDKDEFEQALAEVRGVAMSFGIEETDREGIIHLFKTRVRENLHVVLCMSPMGDSFRSRCRMFPSIVNCCTIDWFIPWPAEALLSVSKTFFERVTDLETWEKEALSRMCVVIHTSVDEISTRFYKELRRHYYTTPTSYIGLIHLYLNMLQKKRKELKTSRDKFKTGLSKLLKTNELVHSMKEELDALEPELIQKTAETEKLMKTLMVDQEKADRACVVVAEDESIAAAKAKETQMIADDAEADLNKALPYLKNAIKALDALDKNDIAELKVFSNPPDLVMTVMETVCILLKSKTDWASAKILLGDSNFLKKLLDYDKDNVSSKIMKKLDRYIADPNFLPENVEKVSKACKSMCMWVRAMHTYSNVLRVVAPKRERYAAAKAELDITMVELKEKQAQLKEVENHIAQLKESYEESLAEKKKLSRAMSLTTARMRRAKKLTASLSDEQVRWRVKVNEFEYALSNAVGDVFIAAACVAYFGAFTSSYRDELVSRWIENCQKWKLPISANLSLLQTFGDPYEIRRWNANGLPRDSMSIENAILVTRSWRWPLMIDPQNQANRWVRNMEKANGLKVIKLTTPNFLRTLENAIRLGLPVLCEELQESLDPALEPVLLKQTFEAAGRLLIRLGDSDVDYDENFKLYMTTKLANPHYMPDVCIKVTIINFTVTKLGLEDQILSDVVRLERPDLEEQRDKLILSINSDKAQLKSIEDLILKLLFKTTGNILDHEDLINTLDDSKKTSSVISTRLEQAQETETSITHAREKYRPVAARGSVLYFVISSLPEIDPMYQFSLQYFNDIFNMTISTADSSNNLKKRLRLLMDQTTYAVYRNVSRGLFERHKLIFSFMLCIEILKQDTEMKDEWNFFLRGAVGVEREYPQKPKQAEWLTNETWKKVIDLEDHLKCFRGISSDLLKTPIYCALGGLEVRLNPASWDHYTVPIPPPFSGSGDPGQSADLVGHWEERLNMFQKLLLVRFFMEEKLVSAVTDFVVAKSGKIFVENPPVSIGSLYEDMTKDIPLVFVLTTGSDPMEAFLRFAKESHPDINVEAISLGQGQGPIAEKLLVQARDKGGWVFLQNCHLAKSFMPHLEDLFKGLKEDPSIDVHEEFRLFLSSMPASFFPVSILQGSVKVTNEPPKGLRSNIRGAFSSISDSFFEDHFLGVKWRKMIFGICFFHAIIQERKKFGPLGWNISYEFNDSDRECALLNLDLFCQSDLIPWDALVYITGEITYGGRVTDAIDQRCLRSTLLRFFHQKTLYDDYKYSESGVYFAPSGSTLAEFEDYVNKLPIDDDPEVFGMHDNANLSYQKGETQMLVNTILGIQPRVLAGGGGETNDDIVSNLASNILEKIADFVFDMEKAEHKLFKLDLKGRLSSLTTVLQQEIERFEKLLQVLLVSLKTLKKAISGFVVMSEDVEAMYTSFLDSRIPQIWEAAAYPSTKPLGSWVKDLILRCSFMKGWLERGVPGSFWISGFFFPQGFLTGVLQNHARKHDQPIDRLSFRFCPIPFFRDQFAYDEESRNLAFQAKAKSDSHLPTIRDGVFVHGLYTDAFRFDPTLMKMASEKERVMHEPMTMLHMEPKMDFTAPDFDYQCPLYKTTARAGILSTTGHSTNFVIFVHLPSDQSPDFWISRGSALLCGLND